MAQEYVLSDLQHGKAECRLVTVERTGSAAEQHVLHDLNVTTQLRGDFAAAYTDGDNTHVHATDTQKNTVFALARKHGVSSPEELLLHLAAHWRTQPWVTGTWFGAEQAGWARLGNGHSFVRTGEATRTAWVQTWGEDTYVLAGVRDLVVLKSTGSEFHGFPRDEFTTLPETDDRILATSVTATWRYAGSGQGLAYDDCHERVRTALLDAFAHTHSLALQQTIHAMASAALDAVPEIDQIRISCPNKHHFLVDLSPFAMDNPGEVFVAADRPYGLISATLSRTGAEEPRAWAGIGG
ncbi:urate oxidase [Nocardioides sp. zg-536]|uniref:Uricase n=2 Tax=Nocardioides faecalis TaxID=2803858 RepID=A0A939BV57_9ACTN|nr:urate oxidase [Nocardioides faecalis]MBS4753654.1 urate oxidase [Nocardioides faecalis]QVI60688.1 urate oxidase [Nocardioides faecalis]